MPVTLYALPSKSYPAGEDATFAGSSALMSIFAFVCPAIGAIPPGGKMTDAC